MISNIYWKGFNLLVGLILSLPFELSQTRLSKIVQQAVPVSNAVNLSIVQIPGKIIRQFRIGPVLWAWLKLRLFQSWTSEFIVPKTFECNVRSVWKKGSVWKVKASRFAYHEGTRLLHVNYVLQQLFASSSSGEVQRTRSQENCALCG